MSNKNLSASQFRKGFLKTYMQKPLNEDLSTNEEFMYEMGGPKVLAQHRLRQLHKDLGLPLEGATYNTHG